MEYPLFYKPILLSDLFSHASFICRKNFGNQIPDPVLFFLFIYRPTDSLGMAGWAA